MQSDWQYGQNVTQIARKYEYDIRTVNNHIKGRCCHGENIRDSTEITKAEVREKMNQLAEEKRCLPSPTEWDGWDARPCSSSTVKTLFGDWTTARKRSGLNDIASGAAKIVREAAYKETANE